MTVILVTAIPVTGMTIPHKIEICYGSALHCYSHDVDESGDSAYRICLECGHVYQTPAELLAAWLFEFGYSWPDNETPNAETVPACAYCGHDW